MPVKPLPQGQSFGTKRVYNGKPASQPHTGTDYATPVGTPVLAVADETVVVAEGLFVEGNAVFIDHLRRNRGEANKLGMKKSRECFRAFATGRIQADTEPSGFEMEIVP